MKHEQLGSDATMELQHLQNALAAATRVSRSCDVDGSRVIGDPAIAFGMLSQAVERLLGATPCTEEQRRVYYQDIVYDVCRKLDRICGRVPGRGIVCGTVEHPSTAVQDEMSTLASIILEGKRAREHLETAFSLLSGRVGLDAKVAEIGRFLGK